MSVLSDTLAFFLLFGLGTLLAWLAVASRSATPLQPRGTFCDAIEDAPFPVWLEQNGKVQWANAPCLQNFGSVSGGFLGIRNFHERKNRRNGSQTGVFELTKPRDGVGDLFSIASKEVRAGTVYYAHDASTLAEAETELNRFVQTLTVTFAHLPIGLAVFDKKQDLTLFNPALSTLLGLAPDWLARRPTMRAFLDRLRNVGAIPEPRDYATLCDEFSQLESGAFSKKYEVEWALPNGQIFRVTGRPHTQGGAALLFEDISNFTALETQFRAELRQLYATLDLLSDAVAIFDQAGDLTYANDAFDGLWKCEMSNAVAPVSIAHLSEIFQKACKPSPVWGELRNFIHDFTERDHWQSEVFLADGRILDLSVSPVPDGCVFCEFRLREPNLGSVRLAETG